MRNVLLFALFLQVGFIALSQPRSISAVKTSQAPKIDGNLEEAAWQQAPLATDFIQNFPTYGLPAASKTEVRILYDNSAVYIAAYLYDDPALIRKQLTSRDGENRQDVDYFSVFFDTYNDQQNGFQFLVTSANVQSDAKITPAANARFGEYGDKTWDAVWQSKTAVRPDGWVVEMRIPYISIRFAKKQVQTWGLQFLRLTRRTNESAFWNPVNPNEAGFVNQFGKYTNLSDIQPPLRLSFSPYLSGGVRFNPDGSREKSEVLASGGMDVKYGINESFTLDMTLIPDFGQVISDNVVNNLSPFEIQFKENRPFFTEGTELFNKSGLFYSRRVGATPAGYGRIESLYGTSSSYEIKKNPSVTKLYNAIKLSGRTEKKLGIGLFNAVTAPMKAQLVSLSSGKDSLIQTEPLTNYNIVVLDQAFKGRSSLTFTNTNVTRYGADADANVAALDWALFNKKNSHSVSGTARYSKTFGYRPYSRAYFFNTDTATINGRRFLRPYDGFSGRLRMGKVNGRIQYYAQAGVESDTYDPNDLGFNQSPNEVIYGAGISYNQFEPTDKFITYSYRADIQYNYLYNPYRFSEVSINSSAFWVFKNFWDVALLAGIQPVRPVDYFELQTKGYQLRQPWTYYVFVEGSTDSRKKLFARYEIGMGEGEMDNNAYYETEFGLRYRFSNRFTLGVDAERQHDNLQIGYAFLREANGAPIVGYRSNKDFTTILSGTYNFTARMNLALRARHYWNQVHYLGFYNVDAEGKQVPRAFIPGQDQNVNFFNLDAFYTWDFKPGCRIVAGWKNYLGNNFAQSIDGTRYQSYLKNFGRTFTYSHGNELTLRVIYFLDYNQLKKRH